MGLSRSRWLSAYLRIVAYNWLTLFGSTLVTISAALIVLLMALAGLGVVQTPYLGILAFLILPGVFVFGLAVIPLGALWEARRRRRAGEKAAAAPSSFFPVLDFNEPRTRHMALVVVVLTMVNLLILSTVSYKAVVYSDSVEFCGLVCHTVMEPEHTAYVRSPHSRVHCVECHIGPGASWFARSKLSGARQVLAVALDTYSKPIATPVHNLRPSKETCEQCHWPARFSGDLMRVIPTYQEDEDNSILYTVLLMHIGGGHGGGHGIHSWHIDPSKNTTYVATDEERQKIALVRVTGTDGKTTEYKTTDPTVTDAQIAQGEVRTMDCIDCHNRPTHIFTTPAKAVDKAMANGDIDASLPYIKKVAVEALTAAKGEEGDLDGIARHVRAFYQEQYADLGAEQKGGVEKAIEVMQGVYRENVFPKMHVTWSTYPNNIGHTEFPGCSRCHDDSHQSVDGDVISQDCNLCHTVLAWDEENPDILKQLEVQ